jgi:large subunit ribosomal protein L22
MEAIASAKYLRGSAQKARLVVDMIRGKDVNKALAILRYSTKRASTLIEKCVRSAIANANEAAEKANVAIDPDDLWVKTAFVDRGPTKGRPARASRSAGPGLSRAAPFLSRDDPAFGMMRGLSRKRRDTATAKWRQPSRRN